ncbi:MAG: peptidylprolyl isomerase [Chthoniobacterales bacterium]
MISVRHAAIFLVLLALPLNAHSANVPPKSIATIPGATLYRGASAEVIDLTKYFTDPDSTGIRLTTVLGTIDLGLYDQEAPLTVANFLNYIDSGNYLITDPLTGLPAPVFFHRSVTNFVIQTGGFLATSSPNGADILRPTDVTEFAPVKNEAGISNVRGTVAMALIPGAPDSATDQWFINLADNSQTLDGPGGFTVFAKVLGNGMAVADAIAALPIFDLHLANPAFGFLPLRDYTTADYDAQTPVSPENAITIPSITRTVPLTFTASSDHPDLATVVISGTNLLVTPKLLGTANITVTATDVDGATVSQTFPVTMISYPVHLANISTRGLVGTNQDALIGGFIVLGDAPKRVAIRALGPSLSSAGLTNVLADPTLDLYNGEGAVIATNNNWKDAANFQEVIDAGLAPTEPNESVILATLPATPTGSAYTAVIQGAGGTGGIGLVEVYDLGSGPGASVLNISTRGDVQTGDNVMIGGFIVSGDGTQRVLVRAIGPTLASAGISDPLDDPTLSLVNGQGTEIDFNDNWMDSPDKAAIEATTIPPTNPKESAVLDTLAPGNYTAIVRGAGTSTGTGLVEVYALPAQ